MLISVIIPVYNVKDYLEKCVESVIDPAFNDYEIILVDDGSTDGVSPALCDALAQKHPELIRVIHQENKGLGGARNTGTAAARGEYVFYPDSDDTVIPGTLSLLASKIKQTGADVISFNIFTETEAGVRTPLNSNYRQYDKPFKLSEHPEFLLSLPNAWSRIWKRSLYTDYSIEYPARVWYEDIRTTPKLFAKAESIVTIPDNLYVYLQRNGSIMRSSNLERNREIIDAFEDILPWFKKEGLYDEYKDILCRLAIDNVYIPASVRVLREDTKHPLLKEFADYMDKNFPDYQNNKYLCELPRLKALVFKLLRGKHYKTVALLFKLKKS
ncbi:MAG: glycosyltransferase family 2 protein [Clostridia bacterium]|nr:glycosyltransferase family 2 protein [Clostridia bacterium]